MPGLRAIGVVRVLEKNGLRPDLVVGSIAGSLVGAFYTAGVAAEEMEGIGLRMSPNILATGLRTGESVLLERGDLGLALQASSSAPGLPGPVMLGGRVLVDGNLAAPVPVDAARRFGAGRVVACGCSPSSRAGGFGRPVRRALSEFLNPDPQAGAGGTRPSGFVDRTAASRAPRHAVGASASLQAALVLMPWSRELFKLAPFDLMHWLLALGSGILMLAVMETWKAAARRRRVS